MPATRGVNSRKIFLWYRSRCQIVPE